MPVRDDAARSRRPDSLQTPYSSRVAYFVDCQQCNKNWRFGCLECAEHHLEYHEGAFEGHDVTMSTTNKRVDEWISRLRQRPQRTQQLFGRYGL